jgi:hypothetical protein
MEIETEFLEQYTNKIDKLISHSNNQNHIIYGLIAFISLSIFGFVASFFLK